MLRSHFVSKARDEAGQGESRASCARQHHRWEINWWWPCADACALSIIFYSVWVWIKAITDFESEGNFFAKRILWKGWVFCCFNGPIICNSRKKTLEEYWCFSVAQSTFSRTSSEAVLSSAKINPNKKQWEVWHKTCLVESCEER